MQLGSKVQCNEPLLLFVDRLRAFVAVVPFIPRVRAYTSALSDTLFGNIPPDLQLLRQSAAILTPLSLKHSPASTDYFAHRKDACKPRSQLMCQWDLQGSLVTLISSHYT